MNRITVAALAVVFILAGASAISFASSGNVSGALTTRNIDGYSVSYNSTTGYINNVSYQNEAEGHVVLASGISVNGTQVTSSTFLNNATSIDGGKVVLFGKSRPQSFGIMTGSSGSSNMSLHLSESAKMMQQQFNLSSSEQLSLGNMGMNSYANMKFSSFEIKNENFSGVLLTDGNASVKGEGSSTHMIINQYNTSLTESVRPLFAVFMTSENIQNLLENHKDQLENSRFTYNSTTGKASGKYVSFSFNNNTNTVTNMNLTDQRVNSSIFSSVKISGNGTIGKGMEIPSFKMGVVQIYGSLFFYANETYAMAIHDNPVAQSSYIVDNGSIVFTLPAGSNVSVLKMKGNDMQVNGSMVMSDSSFQDNSMFGLDSRMSFGTSVLKITTPNLTEMMNINGGNISVKNNSTITVKSKNYSMIRTVALPGLHNVGKYQKRIDEALSSGKISTELSISGKNNSQNFTMNFNSTVNTSITSSGSHHVTLSIGAKPGHTKGTDIAIFLSNSFLQNSHNISIKFDGSVVTSMNMSAFLNYSSSTSASYSVYKESNGDLVIFHVPHFSNHTIEISNTASQSSSPLSNSSYMIPALGIAAVALLSIGAVVYLRKRNN